MGAIDKCFDPGALMRDGFTYLKFKKPECITAMQQLCEQTLGQNPTQLHQSARSQISHLALVHKLACVICEAGTWMALIQGNLEDLTQLLGPDINCQAKPHLRISRPKQEADFIDWHRDTFYGNTPWELNLWFPLYPLGEGAGLEVIPGSHQVPADNVRDLQDTQTFRRTIKKGSQANQLGYVYQPKIDDFLAGHDLATNSPHKDASRLLAPELGSAILFFGCAAHRAQNASDQTRVTLDLRLCNMHVKTQCKAGYYKPLVRGVVQKTAAAYLGQADPVSWGEP